MFIQFLIPLPVFKRMWDIFYLPTTDMQLFYLEIGSIYWNSINL